MGLETQTAYYDVQLYCPQCGNAMSQPRDKYSVGRIAQCLNPRCLNHGKRFQYGPLMVQIHDLDA